MSSGVSNNNQTLDDIQDTHPIRIGSAPSLLSNLHANMDEVAIFNTPLTDAQIKEMSSTGAPTNLLEHSKQNHLVAYWNFEGNEPSKAKDLGPNSLDLDLNGSPIRAVETSRQSTLIPIDEWSGAKSLALNNTLGQYGISNHSPQVYMSQGAFSVSVWFKRSSNDDTTNQKYIVEIASPSNDRWLLYVRGASQLGLFERISLEGTNFTGISHDYDFQYDTWYHVAASMDVDDTSSGSSGGTAKLYLNGDLVGSSSISTGYFSSISVGCDVRVGSGAFNGSPSQYDWYGHINDVVIYDKALTPGEVSEIYNKGGTIDSRIVVSPENVQAYWAFEHIDGDVVKDISGKARHLTLNPSSNIPLLTTDVPVYQWSNDYSLGFDGQDDYAFRSDFPCYQSSFTVSLWVKVCSLPTSKRTIMFLGPAQTGRARQIDLNTDGSIEFNAHNVGTTILASTVHIETWYHIVVCMDADLQLYAWVNGAPVIQGITVNGVLTGGTSSSLGLYLGCENNSTIHKFANVKLDEVSFWSTILVDSDVAALYGLGTSTQDPLTMEKSAYIQGYWTFETIMDEKVMDKSSKNRHLTVVDAARITSSFVNEWKNIHSLLMTDSSNVEHIPLQVARGNNFTAALWFKTTATRRQFLFNMHEGIGARAIDIAGDGTLRMYSNTNPVEITTTSVVNDGNWHHAALVVDSTDYAFLYLDGQLLGSSSQPLYPITTFTGATLGASTIQGHADSYFEGMLDEFVLFHSALSQLQITEMYNVGVASNLRTHSAASTLVAYYPFDTITETHVHDVTGNGYHLTHTNTTNTVSQSVPILLPSPPPDNDTGAASWENTACLVGPQTGTVQSNLIPKSMLNTMTYSVWAKFMGDQSTAGNFLLLNLTDSSDHRRFFSVNTTSSTAFVRSATDNDNDVIYHEYPELKNGNWHHIVYVLDSTQSAPADRMFLYINGVQVADGDDNYSSGRGGGSAENILYGLDLSSSAYNVIMETGKLWDSPHYQGLPGLLDEMSLFDAALTSEQVFQLYNAGVPGDLSQHSASSNLQAWWRFEEDGTDVTGNGRDLTFTGIPSFSTEVPISIVPVAFANTKSLDLGANNTGTQSGTVLWAPTNASAISFSFWCTFDNLTTDHFPISFGDANDSGDRLRVYAVGPTGQLTIETNTNHASYFPADNSWMSSGWNHIAGTFTANGNVKLYINGSHINTGDVSGEGAKSFVTQRIDIGRAFQGGSYRHTNDSHNGKLDEVSVFDSELSESEVNDLYNGGVPGNIAEHSAKANLQAWWRFEDGNNLGKDFSGYGRDLTMYGSPSSSTDVPQPTAALSYYTFDNTYNDSIGSRHLLMDGNGSNTLTFSTDAKVGTHSIDMTSNSVPSGKRLYYDIADGDRPTTAMTIALWFKSPTSTFKGNNFMAFFGSRAGSGNRNRHALYMHPSTNKAEMYPVVEINESHTATWAPTRFVTLPDITQWVHYAITFDGDYVKLYVNGTLESTGTYSATSTLKYHGESSRWSIGFDTYLMDQTPNQDHGYAVGKFDDVRVYDVALDATEVAALASM